MLNKCPVIPATEFADRRRRMQEQAESEGLDLLIACSNDKATAGQANVRYLTDFAAHFEPACCLLPVRGEAVLLTGPESEYLARLNAKTGRIVIAEEFAHPDEDYPFAKLTSAKKMIARLKGCKGRPVKRIGVIGVELMDAHLHHELSREYELVKADAIMNRARAIKSKHELEVIAYAFKIAEAGITAAVKATAVGVREVEIAAEAEYAMRRMGSEGVGIDTMVGSGKNSRTFIPRASLKKIKARELIDISVIPRYQGYGVAIGRPVCAGGNPKCEVVEAVKQGELAYAAMVENLKPGRLGRDVERGGRAVMAQKELDKYFVYVGLHSVGLIEFEPPIFFSGCEERIAPGMVLSVDVPCFLAPWGGFRLEDGYRITREGCEPLDHFQKGLILV